MFAGGTCRQPRRRLEILTEYDSRNERPWEADDLAEQKRFLLAQARSLDRYATARCRLNMSSSAAIWPAGRSNFGSRCWPLSRRRPSRKKGRAGWWSWNAPRRKRSSLESSYSVNQIGCVNAPSAAMSHTESRTQRQPSNSPGNSAMSLALAVLKCFSQLDVHADNSLAFAADDLGMAQRQRPIEPGTQCPPLLGRRGDGKIGDQDFAGGGEEPAGPQRREERRPAVVEARQLVELHVVDVHVAVELVAGLDLKDVDLADACLGPAPVFMSSSRSSTREPSVSCERSAGIAFQAAPRKCGDLKNAFAVAVREAERRLDPRVGGPHQALLALHQLEHVVRVADVIDRLAA